MPSAAPGAPNSSTQALSDDAAIVASMGARSATARPQTEQLVVEGAMTLSVDDVAEAARSIRKRVEEASGRITKEQVDGGASAVSGSLTLRVPPTAVTSFVSWLDTVGDIETKRIEGTDVSRELLNQEIALKNQHRTLQRLRALLDREQLAMKEILEIEREMTRLRGEIERIEGQNRWLRDRVAFATFSVGLTRKKKTVVLGPRAKLFPGARASVLTLLSPGRRARNRVGAGLVIHTIRPGSSGDSDDSGRVTLELDIFEATGESARHAVIATAGGAIYSDFLGNGQNRFLNPYLGFRLGYGYLDGSAFAFAGTAGVELFKHKYVLLDVNVRAIGLVGSDFKAGLVSSGSLVFAF